MSARSVLLAALEADNTLMGHLTGGVHDATELPDEGVTYATTPGAFDSAGRVKPHAVIRWRSWILANEYPDAGAERGTVEIYLNGAIASIENAAGRLKALLHRQRITGSGEVYLCRMIYESSAIQADEIGGAPQMFVRLHIYRFR